MYTAEATSGISCGNMDNRQHVWKNVGFAAAVLLLWVSARYFYVQLLGGASHTRGFVRFDIFFIFLPPVAAFFSNWYWMRDERTDKQTKWSLSWAAIDLVVLFCAVFFGGDPLQGLFISWHG